LIIDAKGIFEKKRSHWYAREWITAHFDGLDISVTPKNVDRALLIMDTIIKILYLRNHDIAIRYRSTYAVVNKMEIKICIKELRKREKNKGPFLTTGLLYFRMGNFIIKQFTDGDQMLEKQIPAIMARLEIESNRMIMERNKIQKANAIRDENERREKAILERLKKEKRDFRNLLNASARWHEARTLRLQ
jgi:hypothetical protein